MSFSLHLEVQARPCPYAVTSLVLSQLQGGLPDVSVAAFVHVREEYTQERCNQTWLMISVVHPVARWYKV